MYDQYEAAGMRQLFLARTVSHSESIRADHGSLPYGSAFFFGDDMSVLQLPLPLKSTGVLMSKFLVVLVDLMVISIAVILPAYILYGIRSGAGISYWIFMASIFLLQSGIAHNALGDNRSAAFETLPLQEIQRQHRLSDKSALVV